MAHGLPGEPGVPRYVICDFCLPLEGNHVLAAQCDKKCADPFAENGLCDCYMTIGHGTDVPSCAERGYADDDAHEDWTAGGEGGSTWLREMEDRREALTHIPQGGQG